LLTWIRNFEFHTVRGLVANRDVISSSRWAVLPRDKFKCGLVLFSSIIQLCTLIKMIVNCRYNSYLMWLKKIRKNVSVIISSPRVKPSLPK